MGYLPEFDYDIFISYAHVDDETADKGEPGWVAQFREHLEVQLSKRVGRVGAVKIWQDPALEGCQLFDQTIRDGINRSALFLALTSAGYLASEYCRQELKWFCSKAGAEAVGLSVGDRMRVFNLLLNNIPYEQWPPEFGRTSGYPFHDAERDDEFGYPSDPKDKSFQQQMRKLVDSIYKTLAALKEKQPEAARPPRQEEQMAEASFTVFLADTADTLRKLRSRVVSELEQEGIRVIRGMPPPYDAAAHDQAVLDEIGKVDLSVHLLDGLPGREIEGDESKSYPQRQAELAIQHARSQFIWVPHTLDVKGVEDETYKGFLDRLENGPRDDSSYNFVREAPSSVTREVLEKINQLKASTQSPAAPSAALVDTHFKDQLYALDLIRFLSEKNIQPFINPEEDDPRKNMKILEERLKQVNKLIIIYGSVNEEWVRARLGAAVQIAITERCPLKACAVYYAHPRKKEAAAFNLGFLPVYTFDSSDLTDPKSFGPLLEGI
ncbi:MAG: toll/interleukin-1 receptor domain-containing protein [Blastocatellia bacterium]